MVVVIGPCMSMSASGLMGKALLFYDTPGGARIRSPKKTFVPNSQAWEVNKTWFKSASARAKTLNPHAKLAWEKAYPEKCDSWRDIFIGHQIEAWNASPQNDLTWPDITIPSPIPGVDFISSFAYGKRYIELKGPFLGFVKEWGVLSYWWQKLNDPSPPTLEESHWANERFYQEFDEPHFETSYYWFGFLDLTGNLHVLFLMKQSW